MAILDRCLITGGNGSLGKELDFGIKLSIEELDVTSPPSIRSSLDEYDPPAVLCLSSIDIRECEKTPYLAFRVNSLGVYNVATECKRRNIPIIIVSSGSVFNGDKEDAFLETSLPDPQNIYGQSKYCAEMLARLANPKHLILRAGWLFGFSKSSNFFSKFVSLAREDKQITATNDQLGSPTYIKDFLSASKELIGAEKTGIFHVVNSGRASAYDLAEKTTSVLNSKSTIRATSISESEKVGPRRSRSEVLVSEKISLRTWENAFEEYAGSLRCEN